jgi:hypothetical protein
MKRTLASCFAAAAMLAVALSGPASAKIAYVNQDVTVAANNTVPGANNSVVAGATSQNSLYLRTSDDTLLGLGYLKPTNYTNVDVALTDTGMSGMKHIGTTLVGGPGALVANDLSHRRGASDVTVAISPAARFDVKLR